MTVVDVVVDGLRRAGASRMFVVAGERGGGWREAIERSDLPVTILARASDACVMASVSGGLTGAPGAVVLGDGIGDAFDGLGYAWSHRLPLIALTSGLPAEEAAGLASATKATLAVSAGSAAHWIAHACQLAMKEPWGPVHLDVPPGVGAAASLPVATQCRPVPLPAPDPDTLDAAVRLLDAAERPLVVVGRLCRSEGDAAWIRAFAEARPAPVLVTAGARGIVPDPHPLVIGTLGGGDAERTLLASADLVVAIAVDPLEVSPAVLPPGTRVLGLTPIVPDASPAGPATVVGDVGSILEELAPRLREARFAEWDVARLHALKQAAAAPPPAAAAPPPADQPLALFRAVDTVRRLTPAGTIAVFGGGDVARAARAWQAVARDECRIAGARDTERFSVAAAAAAQLARPERRVVCFVGAAGAAPEGLEPVLALGLPVLIVSLGGAAPPPGALPPSVRVFGAGSLPALAAAVDAALAARTPALVTVALPP